MPPPAPPVLSPRARHAGGRRKPAVVPDLDPRAARGLAAVTKALGDPTRMRVVDALRKAAPEALCQCDLLPLFPMSQQSLSRHLKVLVGAGVVGMERRGTWAYYFLAPDALEALRAWLR